MHYFKTFTQFLDYIDKNYDEEQNIIIENFMAYYINKYRNFTKFNCESTYHEDLINDKTGELHELALIGFQFEKNIHDARQYKKSIKSNKSNK
jgi:hypothetical protein